MKTMGLTRKRFILASLAVLLLSNDHATTTAFVPSSTTTAAVPTLRRGRSSLNAVTPPLPSMDMIVNSAFTFASSTLVATIDSDIANIPENEFRPVFMGGIIVMFGGLLSALIVGFIIDNKNLYASLVAESYAQTGSDEDFWKGLSDEEKAKAQELLAKVKASNNGGGSTVFKSDESSASPTAAATSPILQSSASEAGTTPPSISTEKKDIGIFSDY